MAQVPCQVYLWLARLQRKTASSWNNASTNPHDIFRNTARQVFQDAEQLLKQAEPSSSSWRHDPFLWTGLWPLIGVALAQEQIATAINSVCTLFDPTQQPLPEQLAEPLTAALLSWNAGQQQEARVLLQRAVPLVQKMGYL